MSSKTKIVVLHMKEIIYTAVFAILAIVFILLLLFMFLPKNKEAAATESKYIPGTYTSTVSLNNTALEVEVSVDESHINSIRFSNLDESVAAMYPLVQLQSKILPSRSTRNSHWKTLRIPMIILILRRLL